MKSDYCTDPADIPEPGTRLDQTVLEVGTSKSYDERHDEIRESVVVKTIVDNGEWIGKKLSTPFFDLDGERFREFLRAVDFYQDGFVMPDRETLVRALKKDLETTARFQSSVRPVKFELDSGKYVGYKMTFFTKAEGESNVNIYDKATQFNRE
jgi:hypothetical protein